MSPTLPWSTPVLGYPRLDDADRLLAQQKLEQKRLEHERQRALQKKAFEEQVSLL